MNDFKSVFKQGSIISGQGDASTGINFNNKK